MSFTTSSLILLSTLILSHVTAFGVPNGSHINYGMTRPEKEISVAVLSLAADDLAAESSMASQVESDSIFIEYCTGCRWMLRSAWMAQELLTTFEQEIDSITLIPSRPPAPGGVFVIRHNSDDVIWDRKEVGRFPESKELKQILRDRIEPNRFLGHSDTKDRQEKEAPPVDSSSSGSDCEDCENDDDAKLTVRVAETPISTQLPLDRPNPNVSIVYCTGCRWLLRAAWVAQELLTTFNNEINSVTLAPSRKQGGEFTISLDSETIWDRSERGRFPELKEIKQMIRDIIATEKDLGHSDVQQKAEKDPETIPIDEMDDDEAEEMRRFFGVL